MAFTDDVCVRMAFWGGVQEWRSGVAFWGGVLGWHSGVAFTGGVCGSFVHAYVGLRMIQRFLCPENGLIYEAVWAN